MFIQNAFTITNVHSNIILIHFSTIKKNVLHALTKLNPIAKCY